MSISYFIKQAGEYGLRYTLGSLLQSKLRLTIREYPHVLALLENRGGLEIGGPSSAFATGGILPFYDHVASLDNCTFSPNTVWGKHTSSYQFSELRPPGQHFISEGTELGGLADRSYDFVLSSHMIEHTANPLGALIAWNRVIREAGTLVLLAPDKERTFDNKRAVTKMEHLVKDFEAKTQEDDLTHLAEMLRDHNVNRTPGWTRERLENFLEHNLLNRGLHHHVFDLSLMREMLEYTGFQVLVARRALPNHLILVGRKPQ